MVAQFDCKEHYHENVQWNSEQQDFGECFLPVQHCEHVFVKIAHDEYCELGDCEIGVNCEIVTLFKL